jgi:DICT domain-containing protein
MLEGSVLQQLAAAHQGGSTGKRRLSFGVYYKNTLVALCHALEDYILKSACSPLVISAFQDGKWYLEEAERYGEIAPQTRQVVILAAAVAGFGEHATSQHPHVKLVELNKADPVAQEWHLIILSPSYAAMVLCQELSTADYGDTPPSDDLQRKFYGLWTFERALVEETVSLVINHMGQYQPELQAQLKTHMAAIATEPPCQDSADFLPVAAQVVDYLQANQAAQPAPKGSQAQLDKNLLSNEVQSFLRLAQLIDLQDATNPNAAAEVSGLAEMLAQMLELPAWQLRRLRLASLLHRLSPLQVTESLLSLNDESTDQGASSPASEYSSCALSAGGQILRKLPQLRAVAQIITHQTEWWDGSGGPAGLAGEEIPIESRILGLLVDFQQRTPKLEIPKTINDGRVDDWQDALDSALCDCQLLMGKRWEPRLVSLLGVVVNSLQQGLPLPAQLPKFTNGLWLLDSELVAE